MKRHLNLNAETLGEKSSVMERDKDITVNQAVTYTARTYQMTRECAFGIVRAVLDCHLTSGSNLGDLVMVNPRCSPFEEELLIERLDLNETGDNMRNPDKILLCPRRKLYHFIRQYVRN